MKNMTSINDTKEKPIKRIIDKDAENKNIKSSYDEELRYFNGVPIY